MTESNASPRPRRSVLFMPASNPRALQKASELPVDGVVLDLEDAVAPSAKADARARLAAVLQQQDFGHREVIVRINALDTPWGEDDIAVIPWSAPDAVLLPKIESPGQVQAAVDALDAYGARSDLPVWLMIETPRGVLEIDAIVKSHARVQVVVMGTSDLAKELRIEHTVGREGLVGALAHCVLAARAQGLDILDGVFLDLDDADGFRAVCEQGRRLGFDGKTLIHPKQVAVANRVFGVSETAAAAARRVVGAWQEAARRGEGVVVVGGRLVENLHVDEARRILALHEAISRRS